MVRIPSPRLSYIRSASCTSPGRSWNFDIADARAGDIVGADRAGAAAGADAGDDGAGDDRAGDDWAGDDRAGDDLAGDEEEDGGGERDLGGEDATRDGEAMGAADLEEEEEERWEGRLVGERGALGVV